MGAGLWTLLIILSVIWGANFTFIEIALLELDTFMIVFLRIAIAAVIMLGILYMKGYRLPREPAVWGTFLILALLNAVLPFLLITWGQTHIDSGLAAILNATTPIFSVILTHFLTLDERMTVNKFIGVLLGIAGVCLLIGPDALSGFSLYALGQIAILGATTCYAYGAIHTRRITGQPILVIITVTLLISSLMLLPFVLLFEPLTYTHYSLSTIGAILYLSILGTATGHLIFYYVISRAGATNTLLVAFMVPITALLLGVFTLGEKLSSHALAGMFVVFVSLVVIDGRLIYKSPR